MGVDVGGEGRCGEPIGEAQMGRKTEVAGLSGHHKAALVEQEACTVDEHMNREGLVAVHEVADEDEEQHKDVEVEWGG